MELNSKKLERTSRFINYSISTILCLFLILLSNRIIGDLDNTVKMLDAESFEDKSLIATFDKEIDRLDVEIEKINSQKETIEKTIAAAKENYVNEKQSFDNWLQTRKTLGSPDKDREVVDRAKKLDDYYKVEQEWRSELNSLQNQIDEIKRERYEIQSSIRNEESEAYEKYYTALKWYDLKVFLIRLVFVAPILALGIFFFVRYRRHKFYPLFFGFTLFSVYAFFFGLVPYLPSYGGYVRYSVGIVLSVGLGYYAIKHIRQFIEQKQAELKISTQERAKKIQTVTAEKALENHFCPSCGKDFLLRKWEFPATKTAETDLYKFVTAFCRHCGLELFKNCGYCGTKNFAHLPFCSSCGTKTATGE
jgi:prefoldin subunit 5